MSGRREQRAELEATWMVYDATRPIRKADMEGAATAPTEQPLEAPEAAAMLHGGATPVQQWAAGREWHGKAPLELMTDPEVAALFGITEMDVREARKWAREQAERDRGVTDTLDDTGARH